MTIDDTESGFAGSCFICNSDHADHDNDHDDDRSRGYTRRSVLRTAALAPIAAAGAASLAAPRPARAQTFRQSGEYVIEAGRFEEASREGAAANAARAAIKRLGADLAKLASTGHLNRRSPLPAYVMRELDLMGV